jgi:peptide/nickel transport system substrate-binding protein
MKEKKLHPYISELHDLLESGRVSRREFLRNATLLGLSSFAASQIVGLPRPRRAFASEIKRGGELKVGVKVGKITHPAKIARYYLRNQMSHVADFLAYTGEDNITNPILLEKWEASDDIKTWTLYLRKGIRFNNGDEFTADDVIFTMNEWLNKDVGSSLYGLVGNYLSSSGIEKVNDYKIRLHLNRPEIAVPEHLSHYSALVVNHRTFEGDFIKAPHGTGPFTIETYVTGEICVLKRRNDYWRKGADGNPLPYLDRIKFINLGEEIVSKITALKNGEVDLLDMAAISGVEAYALTKNDKDIKITPVTTNSCYVMAMRSDIKPFSDNRVRMAMKLCQQREKLLKLGYFGEGVLGSDCHVSPMHPEYCPKPVPKYEPEKAKELMKQAGYANGLDLTLCLPNNYTDAIRMGEVLKEDALPAGFKITIKPMPTSTFWEQWISLPFKYTNWNHRSLGTMVMNLAYTVDKDGKPVAWNESHWVDDEFNQLLDQANKTLDVEERRKIFCKLESIQMERGSVGISFWKNLWLITNKKVKGINAHPAQELNAQEAWLAS